MQVGSESFCFLPLAATWSRARHHGEGQKPLRSWAQPLGFRDLDPGSEVTSQYAINNMSFSLSWLTQEAMSCTSTKIGVIRVFPEDLGEIESGSSESSKSWSRSMTVVEEQSTPAKSEIRTKCDLSVFSRTLRTLVLSFLHPSWPLFHSSGIRGNDAILSYAGPLQKTCPCVQGQKPMQGMSADGVFLSQSPVGVCAMCWKRCFRGTETADSLKKVSLADRIWKFLSASIVGNSVIVISFVVAGPTSQRVEEQWPLSGNPSRFRGERRQ